MDTGKLLNKLLLTKDFYKRLTDKKPSLGSGIIALGVINISALVLDKYKEIFVGKSQGVLLDNIFYLVVMALIAGLMDVLFFSLPLFDLFKVFKKEIEVQSNSRTVVRIMKIQVTANLLVFLPSLVVMLLLVAVKLENYPFLALLVSLTVYAIPVWFCAIITRGINSIYSFQNKYRILVFPAVFIWYYMVDAFALSYVMDKCFGFLIK